jgi:hypothetical protein
MMVAFVNRTEIPKLLRCELTALHDKDTEFHIWSQAKTTLTPKGNSGSRSVPFQPMVLNPSGSLPR